MKRGTNKHRGALLAAAVKETGANITKLTKRMKISRGTYYNHKSDPDLSLELLAQYGKYLRYDFSEYVPELKTFTFDEADAPYKTPKTLAEAIEQRDYWKERYYKKAEDYNQLVLEMKRR